jgi:S-adenosylmethionine uptake transporter
MMAMAVPLRWLGSKGYMQGVFWAVVTCLVSASNDVLMRLMGERLHGFEVAFFRFFFSLLTLLPFLLRRGGFSTLRMRQPHLHLLRAVLGVLALTACCYAVVLLPLSQVTTIFFTQPLFVLALAALLLQERVGARRWMATAMGFAGIAVTTLNTASGEPVNLMVLIPVGAAILFAFQDILIKKMVGQEDQLTMLFHFAAGTTLAALVPACFFWTTPTAHELFFLACLGVGANLIQLTLFKAFSAAQVSALAPFRYVELLFSTTFGLVLFGEIPLTSTLAGAAVIIPATLYVAYAEVREKAAARKKQKTKG